MDWLKEAKAEDFPEQHQQAIRIVGLEKFVELALAFKKTYLYFGHVDRIENLVKERYLKKHFTGTNHAELARATDWSLVTVYEKLRKDRNERQLDAFSTLEKKQ